MFCSAVAATSLCGNWAQSSSGSKCSTSNQCCVPQDSGATIPSCPANPVEEKTSMITEETYQFAGNGDYKVIFRVATGQSCPLTDTSGTVLFSVTTEGTYTREGNNTELGDNWEKVQYTPKRFVTTIVKNNQASPFTNGVAKGDIFLGPCMLMTSYLNNLDVGCPCNDTWAATGVARTIEVSKCPLVNSTNGSSVSSCPENFFFNTASKYGNIRISNQTGGPNATTFRLLEITQPNFNSSLGYNTSTVYANFTADFECPSVINSTVTGAPTMAQSDAFALTMPSLLFTSFVLAWL
jgi:hypothetical protein